MPGIVQGTEYTNEQNRFVPCPCKTQFREKSRPKKKSKQTYNYKLWYLLQGKYCVVGRTL